MLPEEDAQAEQAVIADEGDGVRAPVVRVQEVGEEHAHERALPVHDRHVHPVRVLEVEAQKLGLA
jgi:hypothetical protein